MNRLMYIFMAATLVSSEVLVKFFLKKLFEDNLIDADTYVYAVNAVKDECRESSKK